MSRRDEYEEKSITVLEVVGDVESVLNRYVKKGWEPVRYVHLNVKPDSIKIILRRKKK